MIGSLQGILESATGDTAIINVNGIGFLVHAPTSTLSALGTPGKKVKVYTQMNVREDGVSLFAFASPDELRLFQILTGVQGLGPKLGLSMLSAMNVEQLTAAIAGGNTDLLKTIPGIGKKLSERLVLELRDKVGAGWTAIPTIQTTQDNEVISALMSLGYSVAEASRDVANLPSDLTLEEKIKLALQSFGGK
jgi:holliday junction DNA helicase RuvA